MNAPVSLAALLKREYERDDQGRFSSAGDETGAGAPKAGEKFIVYRMGDKSGDLTNRNAGNAHAVATHAARMQGDDGPTGAHGVGNVVTAHEITVKSGFGLYSGFTGKSGDAKGAGVGRVVNGKQVAYSFPKGAQYTSKHIGTVTMRQLGAALQAKGYDNFDDSGSNKGAEIIRDAFKARKVDLGLIAKWDENQPRDEQGRWGQANGSEARQAQQSGRVHPSSIPRAEPGALSDRSRAVETRFAAQLAQSIPAAEAAYAQLKNTGGGRILNTDDVRELSADYRNDRATLSPAVHEPASHFTKLMYANRLAEAPRSNTVLFTAGGAGSGKSSGIKDVPEMAAMQNAADVVYDTNMNKFGSAQEKIDQALASGRDVHIAYVMRDPVESLTHGALPRAMGSGGGRTVPLAEHIKTHVGAAETVQKIAAHYVDNPRVAIHYIDNSHGRGGARLGDASLPGKVNADGLSDRLDAALKGEYEAGRISHAVYTGTKGSHGPRHP